MFVDPHSQPSDNPCMGSLLQQYYGHFTPELTIRNILGPLQSGVLLLLIHNYACVVVAHS